MNKFSFRKMSRKERKQRHDKLNKETLEKIEAIKGVTETLLLGWDKDKWGTNRRDD